METRKGLYQVRRNLEFNLKGEIEYMQDYIPRRIDINGVIDTVTVKQFDNDSRLLEVTISDTDLADDSGNAFDLAECSAALYIQPEGNDDPAAVSFLSGTVESAESGVVTFLLPGSVTQTVGRYECEIWIFQGDETTRPIISTKPFPLVVEKSIRNGEAIESSQNFSALDNMMVNVTALNSRMNTLSALAAAGTIPTGTVENEVLDARVGWNGASYANLGSAVREQLTSVNNLSLMGGNAYINEARFSSLFGNDFNNVPNNRIYPVGINNGDQIDHSPGTVIKGTLITFGRNNSRMYGDSQVIVTLTGAVWHRTFWRDDNMNDYWTEWTRQTKITEFKALDDRFSAFDKPWNGLKVSVLGDSISTFPGKIPQGNDSYYTTSGSKSIASVNSMWWKQLCDLTGATPLVIEAWSGTCCADPDYNAQGVIRSGREDRPSAVATSYVSNGQTVTLAQPRCQSLHKTDTSSGTSVTVNPDIIVVALGCNDYYYNVPLGTWDGHGVLSPSDTKTWRGAYANMILKIQSRYPDALIFCFSPWFCVRGHSGTSPENVPAQDMAVNVNGLNKTYQDYEDAMREICEALQCVYIDTNNFGFTRSNYQNFVVDYNQNRGETVHPMTHPNAVGQEMLGQSIASAVRDKAVGYVNWLRNREG